MFLKKLFIVKFSPCKTIGLCAFKERAYYFISRTVHMPNPLRAMLTFGMLFPSFSVAAGSFLPARTAGLSGRTLQATQSGGKTRLGNIVKGMARQLAKQAGICKR